MKDRIFDICLFIILICNVIVAFNTDLIISKILCLITVLCSLVTIVYFKKGRA